MPAIVDCEGIEKKGQGEKEATEKKQIAKQMDKLIQTLVETQELLSKLQDRLTPVIFVEPADPAKEGLVSIPGNLAPLALTIRDEADKAKQCNEQISWILKKIEL